MVGWYNLPDDVQTRIYNHTDINVRFTLLLQGVSKVFSNFRSNVNLINADLTKTNLSGLNFSGNLTRANLTGANLTDAKLIDAKLSGANLSGRHW